MVARSRSANKNGFVPCLRVRLFSNPFQLLQMPALHNAVGSALRSGYVHKLLHLLHFPQASCWQTILSNNRSKPFTLHRRPYPQPNLSRYFRETS